MAGTGLGWGAGEGDTRSFDFEVHKPEKELDCGVSGEIVTCRSKNCIGGEGGAHGYTSYE